MACASLVALRWDRGLHSVSLHEIHHSYYRMHVLRWTLLCICVAGILQHSAAGRGPWQVPRVLYPDVRRARYHFQQCTWHRLQSGRRHCTEWNSWRKCNYSLDLLPLHGMPSIMPFCFFFCFSKLFQWTKIQAHLVRLLPLSTCPCCASCHTVVMVVPLVPFRSVTASSSLPPGPVTASSWWRPWAGTVATSPHWVAWPEELMLLTSLRRSSHWKTYR